MTFPIRMTDSGGRPVSGGRREVVSVTIPPCMHISLLSAIWSLSGGSSESDALTYETAMLRSRYKYPEINIRSADTECSCGREAPGKTIAGTNNCLLVIDV